MIDTSREPDFINEEGTKWWFNKSTTQYALQRGHPGVRAWVVEVKDGARSHLLTKGEKVLYESQQLEALGCFLDVFKFVEEKPVVKSAQRSRKKET